MIVWYILCFMFLIESIVMKKEKWHTAFNGFWSSFYEIRQFFVCKFLTRIENSWAISVENMKISLQVSSNGETNEYTLSTAILLE